MPAMRQTERARLFQRAKQALRARREQEERVKEKTSRYLQAGAPLRCFLPSCQKPFLGACIHANDGRFYCSNECADRGDKIDLSRVEPLRARK